jgi:hypothetical protein
MLVERRCMYVHIVPHSIVYHTHISHHLIMNAHHWPEMAMEELVALMGREDSAPYGRIESDRDVVGFEVARAWRHKICDW